MVESWISRLEDHEKPFVGNLLPQEELFLKTLNLNEQSSAEDVRRVAVSTRLKFENEGIQAETMRALSWALGKTNDTRSDTDLLLFMLDRLSFECIEDRVHTH